MKRAVTLVMLLGVCFSLNAQELRTLKDVTYGEASGRNLALDAYLWDGPRLASTVIFIHGGGWRRGGKASVPEFLRRPLFGAGISLISVNYRLSGEAIYPAQVEDVTRAVQFVRLKAKEWRLNGERIAVMGTSAGAHLALWIGLHDDRAKPNSSDAVERESTRVSAIVNYFGPTDFHLLKTIRHNHPAYFHLFGLQPGDPPDRIGDERMTAVSPVTYVSSGDPPVFTYHGLADVTVPIEHARRLIGKLEDHKVPNENYLVEKAGHGLGRVNPDGPDFQSATIEFLKKHLRP